FRMLVVVSPNLKSRRLSFHAAFGVLEGGDSHFALAVRTQQRISFFVAVDWQCSRLLRRDTERMRTIAEPRNADAGVNSISGGHSLCPGFFNRLSQSQTWTRSVPPRGSEWVNQLTHPLPRGGTDLIQRDFDS